MSDTADIELMTQAELDQKVVSLRIAGVSLAAISKELNLGGVKEVTAALERGLPVVDASYRARILREELQRLDQLQSWWFVASRTSISAAAITLKIAERRSALLGLDAPQHVRMVIAEAHPQSSSTEVLLRELNRIAANSPANSSVVLEGRADPGTADPPSDPSA